MNVKMECCRVSLGGRVFEQERYFIKSDYMTELSDYFDKSDVASFRTFDLDSCLLKDFF